MKTLRDALREQFVVVNLGCIGDPDYVLPDGIVKTMTVVEIDAQGEARTKSPYHRKIVVDRPISGRPGKHTFIRNTFDGTCSLLAPRPGMVERFGMERYCRTVKKEELLCETLPELLTRHGLSGLDFLKTDIEGMDSAVVKSCEGYLGKTLAIQSELRFEPFYETEPAFHELVSYLADYGYEVLDILHIDRWKYKTRHWHYQVQGRALWADFLFFLRRDKLAANFKDDLPEAVAKQIVLACMLGKKNYGEFLLQEFSHVLPDQWKPELTAIVRPRPLNGTQMLQALRRAFMPLELFLKHRINRSRHVSVRLAN